MMFTLKVVTVSTGILTSIPPKLTWTIKGSVQLAKQASIPGKISKTQGTLPIPGQISSEGRTQSPTDPIISPGLYKCLILAFSQSHENSLWV